MSATFTKVEISVVGHICILFLGIQRFRPLGAFVLAFSSTYFYIFFSIFNLSFSAFRSIPASIIDDMMNKQWQCWTKIKVENGSQVLVSTIHQVFSKICCLQNVLDRTFFDSSNTWVIAHLLLRTSNWFIIDLSGSLTT